MDKDRELAGKVDALLGKHGFPASRLELDIPENATLAGDENTNAVLSELRHLGVRIAVDDFGAGSASLTYLRILPLDVVKIDQVLIAGLDKTPADRALVLGMIGTAHGLGLSVVAKGVETTEQRDFLRVAGCDIAQGFLLGRPVPLDDLGL